MAMGSVVGASSDAVGHGERTHPPVVSITVRVHPDHDDPEWIADEAWGSLANECARTATFGDIVELPADEPGLRQKSPNRDW